MHDLIERFLGEDAARGGPCALLGLPPEGLSDLDIISARDRRMRMVDAHPQSQSPAADEVRLALHAATAQLLNPAVASHIRRGSASTARASTLVALEQDVILTLAMFGGWTRRCMPRLMALAHSRGLTAQDVAETLGRLARRRPAGGGEGRGALAEPPEDLVAVDRPPGPGLAIAVGTAAIALIAATVWVVLTLGRPIPTGDTRASPLERVERPSSDDQSSPDRVVSGPTVGSPVAPPARIRAEAVLETLLAAVSQAEADPDQAATSAVAAIDGLAEHWLELSNPVRTRALDAIVELMYRLGGPTGDARELLHAVGRGSIGLRSGHGSLDGREVTRAVWSVGALARLKRERDLSAQSHALLDRWLGASLQSARPAQFNFAGGAVAALQSIMPSLAAQSAGRGEAWRAWSASAAAVTAGDAEQRFTLIARGAELLLMQPITPDQRSDLYEAIQAAIKAMPWGATGQAERWMARQFDNRDVSAASLSAATRAVIADTGAPNVDPTMVLSATASELERRALRDRYLLAWGLEEPGSDIAVLDALTKAAAELDADLVAASSPMDALRVAVAHARLNAAAAAQWQGDAAAAIGMLEHFRVPPTVGTRDKPVPMPENGGRGWAERYLAAGPSLEDRVQLLEELRASNRARLGAVDAEVLVETALRGTGRGVRELARDLVELFGSSPTIVNALLEEAPRIPPTRDMSDLIVGVTLSPLPDRNSPEWRMAVRRALVERLGELLAAEGEVAGIDELAGLLDDAYYELALIHRSVGQSGDRVVPPAERSVRGLTDRWRRTAERTIPAAGFSLSLGDVERRRAGRLSLAQGLVQAFAVEELALAETMAVVVASEQPRRAEAVESVLAELAQQRRDATHIFQQIAAAERAMVRLWQIRMGVDGL